MLVAAVVALAVANSPMSQAYFDVLHRKAGPLTVMHWVNDGLMALFFLHVGLVVKSEILVGQLAKRRRRILPGAAAIAGVIVPALIYVGTNAGSPGQLRGWAVPAATDIAFALGVLALLGSRVPVSLKVLLTAIAVIDDLLAIIVIALFYTSRIALEPLALAIAGLAILITFNRAGVRFLLPYLIVGTGIWWGVLQSGVHGTLAGVVVAFTIPLRLGEHRPIGAGAKTPLHLLEHRLQPWVSFLIVPLFGLANAGLSFAGISWRDFISPLPLGIALGLFVGKQVGIVGAVWAMIRLNLAHLPAHATWRQVWGMAALCGIGFTMSLFIGGLAFPENDDAMEAVKLGVLFGSMASGFTGWMILTKSLPERRAAIV